MNNMDYLVTIDTVFLLFLCLHIFKKMSNKAASFTTSFKLIARWILVPPFGEAPGL